MDIRLSKTISTARIWAIFSIVAAHVSFDKDSFSTELFSKIGSIGVIVFIIMAGYLFNPQKFEKFSLLLKNKATSIGVPWLFFGTLTYLYKALLSKAGIQALEYVKWILGNGTFLYYLTVLMICYVIFYKFNSNKICIAAIVLNLVSLLLTSFGLLNTITEGLHISNYLNFFNWIGYFSIGHILKNIDSSKIFEGLKKFRFVFIGIFAVAFGLAFVLKIEFSYFSKFAFIYLMFAALAVFGFSTFALADIKFLEHFSNSTFTIYLFHMIVIGLTDKMLSKFLITQLISPVIIALICFIVLNIIEFIAKKIKLDKIFYLLSGIRVKKISLKNKNL